jgi:hypothetical protein
MIWRNRYVEGVCVINTPAGIKDDHELTRGMPRAAGWAKNVTATMSDEYPKDIALGDNLFGTNLIVVSSRIKEALEAEKMEPVEFLPLSIVNHKKKVASSDYYILNPPFILDCIDLEASEVKWNLIDKTLISRCKRLVLREPSVPANAKVFRAKHLPTRILVRDHVVKKLNAAGLTGLHFSDPAEFRGA